MNMQRRRTGGVGRAAETLAVQCLINDGHVILERNYRVRAGEIDIISRKDGIIVFSEVKYRRNDSFARPCEAVGRAKQKKICRAAALYLGGRELACRFDVIEITGIHARDLRVYQTTNAFEFHL